MKRERASDDHLAAVERRHRWWRYEAMGRPPVPCDAMDEGAFPVRWIDAGPPVGMVAMDDRYDDQGLLRPENYVC